MLEPLSRFVTADDGLVLHARDYDPGVEDRLPVVCLPGLSRTADDFDRLAVVLAEGRIVPPRRVVALDYRGRGLSAWDPDPKNYELARESADIAAVLQALGIGRAAFVGTSRGGLHTMVLAALDPALLAGAVLNDIGPVLEPEGLRRIQGYIGQTAAPTSWDDAVATMQAIAAGRFTLSDEEWLDYARLTFQEKAGVFSGRYDPALLLNLKTMDVASLPTLWPQFDALNSVPLLVIRGETSDLLSEETADTMRQRHADCEVLVVPGQGHAPLLMDTPTIQRIATFIDRCDRIETARLADATSTAALGYDA